MYQEDVPVWKEVSDVNEDQPQFGKQLSEQQRAELETLLTEFSDVVKTIPGRTNLVEHDIQTGEAHPVSYPRTGYLMHIEILFRMRSRKCWSRELLNPHRVHGVHP